MEKIKKEILLNVYETNINKLAKHFKYFPSVNLMKISLKNILEQQQNFKHIETISIQYVCGKRV